MQEQSCFSKLRHMYVKLKVYNIIQQMGAAFSIDHKIRSVTSIPALESRIVETVTAKNQLKQEQIKSSEAISSNPKCLLNINKGKKTSRNERCSVTGKKFKQCCGALQL